MAVDLEKLVVQLSADIKGFDKELAKAVGVSNRQFNAVERRARQMNRNLDSIFSRSFKGLTAPIAGIGAALGVNELRKMTDTWTDMNSRVALAAGGLEKGTEVMERLGDMARRTYSDLEQTAEAYLSNATSLQELGYSTDQALDYTESLNNALVVSGAKGQRAATVTDALAKAMALGTLSGQNLNTVISQGGRVAEALAAGLNTTVGGLRKLGAQGKITGNDLVKALSSQMEVLRKEAADMPATIGDGFVLLNNALLQYVGNADSATGVSAKISEALVIIADNFDKTADVALQLAAVLAGGLLGRSVLNMVKNLGLGVTALKSFTQALAAARTMGGLATAFGGLGAAAGPLGAIIGGAVVGSLALYSTNAAEASQRSQKFEKELVSLGLLSQKTASDIDDAAEAITKLGDAQAAQKLRSIADEIERIRTGGKFGGAGDELNALQSSARGSLWDDKADAAAKNEISGLIYLLQTTQITADEVRKRMDAIRTTPISDSVKELADNLDRTAEKMEALNARAMQLGSMPELDNAKAQLSAVIDDLDRLEQREVITSEQRRNLEDALTKLRDTGDGADEARAALATLSSLSFSTTLMGLDGLIGRVSILFQEATKASGAMAKLSLEEGRASRSSKDPYIQQRIAGNEFEKEALRRAALGKSQLTLENEIAKVRNDALKEGITLTEQQINTIAKANIAGDTARTAEGKKPKKEKKERDNDYERLTKSITDRTATMIAETEVQRQLNPLIDDYGYAIEKARAEQELLNAAEKAKVEITPKLRAEIGATAEQFALATVEAGKLAEAQDKIRQNAEEMADFQKDLTRGMVDGFICSGSNLI